MKRTIIYGALLFSLSLTAQQQQRLCGFDQRLEELDKNDPGLRQTFDDIIRKVQAQKKGASSLQTGKVVNGIYEIPVVVHVIYPTGAAIGSTYNKSDAQIQAWLDRANQMYAGTYAWPSQPSDFGTSATFPIKLVLAKRDPNCNATTGIVRYNGGAISGYNANGVKQQTNSGVTTNQIKTLAPHWPEDAYFNIYVVSMFDADTSPNSGLMGWAAFPTSPNSAYESFMKSGVVSNAHDTTLAHEFGHAMGLYHTFQGGDYTAMSGAIDYCPPAGTGDCTKDNDLVCDTEVSGAAYYQFPTPTNAAINPCTNINYQGVQYNIMNYTNSPAQKFTAGQGDRIQDLFMLVRGSLVTSKGATALPAVNTSVVPLAAACTPSGINNVIDNYLTGPTSVKLAQINNESAGMWANAYNYYVDYTSRNCQMNIHTTLTVNQSQNIQVGFYGNDQSVRVWIDYNNNGTFENSELIASGNDVPVNTTTGQGMFTANFTPPASAVMNTPLRMRVLVDYTDATSISACGALNYGQVEDYSVTLVSNLATNDVKADTDNWVIYPNPSTAGEKLYIKTKNAKNLMVTVSDMSGRLIEKPSLSKEGTGTLRINHHLEKGVYMLQISDGKESKSSKLIIK